MELFFICAVQEVGHYLYVALGLRRGQCTWEIEFLILFTIINLNWSSHIWQVAAPLNKAALELHIQMKKTVT